MRCIVLLYVVACARAAAGAATSCAGADQFLARYNVSADDSDQPGALCSGHCCGRRRETQLRSSLRRAAEASAGTATSRIADLLLTTRGTLLEHLVGLSHQSQNKTSVLFSQLYRGHATRAHAPLSTLYEDIRSVLKSNPNRDVITEDLSTRPPKDLVASAKKFFREIFPVAYQNALKLDLKQFTPEYEACLQDAYEAVQPFGEVPMQLGTSLARSLEAARALLQMLAVGALALTTTEHVLSDVGEQCSNKLLHVAGCARCRGHDIKPCRSYCLNVARGCIGSLLAELEGPWAGYVEGVERLTRVDADVALRELETKVSKAIMYALENRAILENKVRRECGPPSTLDTLTSPQPTPSVRREDLRAPPPDTELLEFAATLAGTKKLFAGLADRLCDQHDFAHDSNDHCWNGETIGEYTKALVPSASLSDQKYNPELSGGLPQDPRVAALADRLQQARQLLIAHTGSNDAHAEAFIQGDEAGEEGSGSGRSYPDDDATYDSEGSGEEGSGSQDTESRTAIRDETPYSSTPKTSSATTLQTLSTTTVMALAALTTRHCIT